MRVRTGLIVLGIAVGVVSLTACSDGSTSATAPPAAARSVAAVSRSTGSASEAASSPTPTPATSGGAGTGSSFDTCSLLSATQASSLVGRPYTSAVSQTIADGQDQCTYATSDPTISLMVIVYQPTSGVSLQMLSSVLGDSGDVTPVTGVGDKAIVGQIELDVQTGERVVAVEGAGGTLSGDYTKAVAVAKAVIGGLH